MIRRYPCLSTPLIDSTSIASDFGIQLFPSTTSFGAMSRLTSAYRHSRIGPLYQIFTNNSWELITTNIHPFTCHFKFRHFDDNAINCELGQLLVDYPETLIRYSTQCLSLWQPSLFMAGPRFDRYWRVFRCSIVVAVETFLIRPLWANHSSPRKTSFMVSDHCVHVSPRYAGTVTTE